MNYCQSFFQSMIASARVNKWLVFPFMNIQYLIDKMFSFVANLHPDQVILLNFELAEDVKLSAVHLIAAILSNVWLCHTWGIKRSWNKHPEEK